MNNRFRFLACFLLFFTPIFASGAWGQSLYNEKTFRSYVEDQKAYKTGDVITVIIEEISSAESEAGTTAHRGSDFDASIQDFGGLDVGDISIGTKSSGGGKIKRKGDLRAQLTVTVMGVDEYGTLEISGEQRIVVNDEEQRIVVKGKVRPEDISQNNTVQSTRISDARIEYMGKGVIGDSQKPGAIYKFFNWLGII